MSILQMRTVKYIFLTILLSMVALPCYAQDKITTIEKIIGTSTYQTTLGEDNDKVVIGKIGDSLTRLSPVIKLTKWDEEESLTLTYPGFSNLTPTISADGTITIGNSSIGFYFNRFDNENLKFGLILKKKPDDSYLEMIDGIEYIRFRMLLSDNWKDFDYIYHTPWVDINGKEIYEYKDNNGIIRGREIGYHGSWTIRHKTKRNHEIGETNYRAGIFGVIKRPVWIDADGNRVNGLIMINDGYYDVYCPSTFLNNKYPIYANDEFGNEDTGANYYDLGTNTAIALRANLTVDGTITAIHAYGRATATTKVAKGILYDHDSGDNSPEVLRGVSAAVTLDTTNGWDVYTLTSSYSAVAAYYWLGVVSGASSVRIYYEDVAGAREWIDGDQSYASPVTPWDSGGATSNEEPCIYATYTAGGGGGDDGGTTAGAMRRDRRVIIFD